METEKLSSKPERVTKRNEPVVLKRQFVDVIQAALGIELETLGKMSKADLATLCEKVADEMPEPEQG